MLTKNILGFYLKQTYDGAEVRWRGVYEITQNVFGQHSGLSRTHSKKYFTFPYCIALKSGRDDRCA